MAHDSIDVQHVLHLQENKRDGVKTDASESDHKLSTGGTDMTAKVPQIKVLTRHTMTIQIDPNIILCLGPWKHVRPSGRTRHGTIFAAIMHYMHQILISPVMSAVGRTHSGMILVDSEHGVGAVTLPDEADVHCHAVVEIELHGTSEQGMQPTGHRTS